MQLRQQGCCGAPPEPLCWCLRGSGLLKHVWRPAAGTPDLCWAPCTGEGSMLLGACVTILLCTYRREDAPACVTSRTSILYTGHQFDRDHDAAGRAMKGRHVPSGAPGQLHINRDGCLEEADVVREQRKRFPSPYDDFPLQYRTVHWTIIGLILIGGIRSNYKDVISQTEFLEY